jgi:hypothetical protein
MPLFVMKSWCESNKCCGEMLWQDGVVTGRGMEQFMARRSPCMLQMAAGDTHQGLGNQD